MKVFVSLSDMSLINNTRFAKLRRFVRHHVEDYGRRSSTTQQSSREPPQVQCVVSSGWDYYAQPWPIVCADLLA